MSADLSVMSPSDARRLTDKIKVAVEGTWHLIEQAYTSRAWDALGYESWDDYCTREFGTSRLRLPREERQEVVASLRESGLSLRAIESATGVSPATVMRDLRTVSDETGTHPVERVTGTNGQSYAPTRPSRVVTEAGAVDTATGEVTPAPLPAPARETYTRIDVVRVINQALYHAGQAAQAAEQIRREHLKSRNEEAAVWVGRLSTPLAELQRLHDALQEASA